MRITQRVKKIMGWYEGDPPAVKGNLARILMTGKRPKEQALDMPQKIIDIHLSKD